MLSAVKFRRRWRSAPSPFKLANRRPRRSSLRKTVALEFENGDCPAIAPDFPNGPQGNLVDYQGDK